MNEILDEVDESYAAATRRQWVRRGVIALVVLFVVGAIPKALGFGWFAARLFTSKDIFVYVVNTSGQDLTIELPFAQPQTVRAGTVEVLETLSGPITILTTNAEGELVEELEWDADGHLLYNALGSECMAVIDVTPYYGDQSEGSLRVVARIPEGRSLYPIEAGAVMLPRHLPPDRATPPIHWIETFGCDLLAEDQEAMLLFNAHVRLQDRWERYQEELRQIEEAQGQ